ncbi:MAG: hypothetical protein MRJ96_12240 [Nitrospirales bacterium]|nr:hypothetical protein [Nitrospira sp.]MDR4502211.1 hypothetical protein [Nitrospirales bacterium]
MSQLTRGQKRRLMYIELKSGFGDSGPARIGWERFSKSGQSVYYNSKRFIKCAGVSGNFYDVETGEEYWISGVKKRGTNRHWAGKGPVEVDADAVEEYESYTTNPLPNNRSVRSRT